MNPAHLHLLLNHIPVLGCAAGLLLFVSALRLKSEELKKVSLWFFFGVSLISIPTYFTGEPAEELIEGRPGISETLIEEHEEAATPAFVSILVLGAASLGFLIVRRKRDFPQWMPHVIFILSLSAAILMARAANMGGQISHPEIQNGLEPQ